MSLQAPPCCHGSTAKRRSKQTPAALAIDVQVDGAQIVGCAHDQVEEPPVNVGIQAGAGAYQVAAAR